MHHAALVDTPFELKDVCVGQVIRERELRQWLPAQIRNQQLIGLPVHRNGQLVLYAGCSGAKPDDSHLARAVLHACAHATHDRNGALTLQTMLTTREADCLYWLAQGKTYAETGKILALSNRTVRAAVAATKPKLGARSKSEAIAKAVGRAAAS